MDPTPTPMIENILLNQTALLEQLTDMWWVALLVLGLIFGGIIAAYIRWS